MDKKVYIIIVTWRGMNWIRACLMSCCKSNYPVNVIVVDNNSPDETPDFIDENYPEVHLIRSKKNLGFGRANNIGMEQALADGADYCFLLNQDAYLQSDTIGKLVTVAEAGDYGILSPVHLNGDGSHVDYYFRDFVMAKCPEYLENAILGGENNIFENYNIPAAGWLLPKGTLLKYGMFDSLFYHYGEDDNYLQRMQYHRVKVAFTTKAFILHDRNSTVGNKGMYNNNLFYRHLLVDATNINNSMVDIVQKTGRQFYDDMGLWFMYLFTGKWHMLRNYPKDYIKLLLNIHRIKKSRKTNKNKCSNI